METNLEDSRYYMIVEVRLVNHLVCFLLNKGNLTKGKKKIYTPHTPSNHVKTNQPSDKSNVFI